MRLRPAVCCPLPRRTVAAGAPNLAMVELLQLVQNELGYGATHMWYIERWISLTVPPHEDGNNFGVDVQASVLKTVQRVL